MNLSRKSLTRPIAQDPQPHPTAGEVPGGSSTSSHEEAIVRLLEAGDNMADALEGDYADIWDGAVDAFNDARAESS